MVVPAWLKHYITESDLNELEAAVQSIETQTDVEIVPIVVRSSSNYHQVQVTVLMLGFLGFSVAWHYLGGDVYWDAFYYSLFAAIIGLILLFGIVPWLSKIRWVQRALTIRAEEFEQCWKRAKIEFYENSVHHTQRKTGLLIFISLLEHTVIVLADEKISKKLPQETWQNTVDGILAGLKERDLSDGLKKGLAVCSPLLIENFPVQSSNPDELPNRLIIKE